MIRPDQTKTNTTPPPPPYLSVKATTLWKETLDEYLLSPEMLETFRIAVENMDLADSARALLRKDGLIIANKKHPAADLVKLHDGLFLRSMRQLGLDVVASQADAGRRVK